MHAIMEANEISEDEQLEIMKKNLGKQEKRNIDMQQIQLEVNLTLKQVRVFRFSNSIYAALTYGITDLFCSLSAAFSVFKKFLY